jgi:ABC-type dipeptide/oligopeptide/nickel transport system ATPase component
MESNAGSLQVRGLTVSYERDGVWTPAVHGASFDLAPGERLAVVGESGSGKSTLISAIAGFLNAPNAAIDYETLEFEGKPLERRRIQRLPRRTAGISMVFQDAMTSLDPVWTVENQVKAVLKRSGAKLSRTELRERVEHWLGRVGLHDTARVLASRPYEMSGGMRQRVMLAVALCGSPRLLVADEPTSALDASLSRDVMDLMAELTAQVGASLVIVTHDITLCLDYAHRLLVMQHGHVVDDVAAATITQDARHPYTRGLLQCVPTLDSVDLEELPTLETLETVA